MVDGAAALAAGLDGPAILALAAAVQVAFDRDELDRLCLSTFSEDLYVEYVPPGLTDGGTALALLRALERRGTVALFLRAARLARPDNGGLLAAIRVHCPEALGDPSTVATLVDAGLRAFPELSRALADPEARGVVAASRASLQGLADGLGKLRAYKAFHDALQQVQVQQFRSLSDEIRRMRTDPTVAGELGIRVLAMQILSTSARRGVAVLDGGEAARELRWLEAFDGALADLAAASEAIDDFRARSSAATIRDIIHYEPPRVNSALRSIAERLPIGQLIGTIDGVARLPSVGDAQRSTLAASLSALQNLWPMIRGSVAVHDNWQDVETQLWSADSELERGRVEDTGDFDVYWSKAQERMGPLWAQAPEAEWVASTRRSADRLNEVLHAAPLDLSRAKLAYGQFRMGSVLQFFRIDNHLGSMCDEILRISRPLSAMLEEARG